MKLYAQHGYGTADKLKDGFSDGHIDGVIFSPRDIKREKLRKLLKRYNDKGLDLLFDPQLYVSVFEDNPNLKKRYLKTWNYYKGYKKNYLELSNNIDDILKEYYRSITRLNLSSIIAPNICISKSFNSIEAVIAKNFIRRTKSIFEETKDDREIYASLIIDWQAFLDNEQFESFIDDLSLVDDKPDGIYLVIGSDSLNPQDDFYISEVISGWMKLNYALTFNGYKVINGYSDILTPLLGVTGGYAGATGWWSNLRYFKMERFIPTRSGGRMPIARYLSKSLMDRIMFTDLDIIKELIPDVLNQLPTDEYYDPEPENRDQEMLQSWETLKSLNEEYTNGPTGDNLNNFEMHLKRSKQIFDEIKIFQLRLRSASSCEHIDNMLDAIYGFKKWAEID